MKNFIIVSFLILVSLFPSKAYASHVEINPCIELSHCVLEKFNVENIEAPYEKIKLIIEETPRTQIVEEDGDYLHAEVTSRIMKYIDDLEVSYSKDENFITVRSESRVGEGDFGVNKKRVEKLKNNFLNN
tara:strand:+ start:283 stop:672 length:390 start_codon:yes stop_codon:yes gene_type:complete